MNELDAKLMETEKEKQADWGKKEEVVEIDENGNVYKPNRDRKMSNLIGMGEKTMRPEVKEFSIEMERVLGNNDYKGHWCDEDSEYMVEKLKEEVRELIQAVESLALGERDKNTIIYDLKNIKNEAIDVANIAMMIWDNTKNKGKKWL